MRTIKNGGITGRLSYESLYYRYSASQNDFLLVGGYAARYSRKCPASALSVYQLIPDDFPDSLEATDGHSLLQLIRKSTNEKKMTKILPDIYKEKREEALSFLEAGDKKSFSDTMMWFLEFTRDKCPAYTYINEKLYFDGDIKWSVDIGYLLGRAGFYREALEILRRVERNHPDIYDVKDYISDFDRALRARDEAVSDYPLKD